MCICESRPEEDENTARRAAETNTELGRQYMARGDYEIALDKLKRAIAHDKTYAPAHTVLAYLYEFVGDDELAGKEYREALKYDPKDGAANNNYGAFLCATGDWEEAETYFINAMDDPFYETPGLALSNAGLCALNSGDLDKAERYLRQSIEYDENLAASLLALSKINYQRGQYLNARAFLQRYEAAAENTEESVYQAYLIERELGDERAAGEYRRILIQQFPQSDAAQQLLRE
jgi:type IV pilus assembly protein PilF